MGSYPLVEVLQICDAFLRYELSIRTVEPLVKVMSVNVMSVG